MDIKEFLLPYPEVRVATRADNQGLLDFFTRTGLQGSGVGITYDRSPDFFAFLDMHSDDYFVLVYEADSQIQGVASYIFRDGYIEGRKSRICYLGDLRIGADRKASRLWRKLYGSFMTHRREIKQFAQAERFYTCLMDDNKLSEKSLARNRKDGFAYHLVSPYSMVTLLAKKPWAFLRSPLRVTAPMHLEELLSFYRLHESQIPSGYVFTEEIPKRLGSWPDFNAKSFLLVRNEQRILAACALWTPRSAKKILVTGAPLSLKLLLNFKEELDVLYITHLVFAEGLSSAEKKTAFSALLAKAWRDRSRRGARFLSFCNFAGMSLLDSANSFFFVENKMAIYEVTPVEAETPARRDHYGFEMALV